MGAALDKVRPHRYLDLSSTVHIRAPTPRTVDSLPGTNQTSVLSIAQTARWSGLILQPDNSLVSEEQLRHEIKAIYAGLLVAEAKCVNLDAAQAKNPSVELDNSQWQESIALHRAYLYEHHDFLMATQHPPTTPDLKALPTMYGMPARLWKYGIHDFLEVLRSRRPSSQDHVSSFIYLAYQMMALFHETAPIFLDTWIECLGDLARYRMSMEEEKEAHAQWGRVAASWYIKASDRHPQIGRLYHHLAILERPSLRMFAWYGKSLTPQARARTSLKYRYVFTPIARCFSWRNCGVSLAVANIAALLGHGFDTNSLRAAFDFAIQRINEQTMLSHSTTHHVAPTSKIRAGAPEAKCEEDRRLLQVSKWMTLNSLRMAMRCPSSITTFRDSSAFVGVMFCFIHILCLAERETQIDREMNMSLRLQFGPDEIEWALVADYLNHLGPLRPITDHLVQCARQGI
ncbi:hypothetical protein LTR91_023665 [Friedmanniomyces endolithicus]|uniref:DNA/RNA-binding domain-containing protein n=1 Tax=Friedmanniomyces endolithicus TaxID=329885 RepID=A0AAN6J405_9PEZI|nr:hypothetical protein LTR35_017691 [Friedmanniomyces endolithicus]KAK0268878.1 hypothetical protein LTS00_017435 [Friedmanniomyces endolithicus]KAK0302741.1 hypothetical protein LTR82_017768 [Friedmanniomyces endolithicus]KAK0891725.1 hypothetical protein LTR57_024684 [Friedmanniomyces endolithicus]KAK0953764.1 hypothetical protein LTR91_023665 [Friedmanniomyces endolithicus]